MNRKIVPILISSFRAFGTTNSSILNAVKKNPTGGQCLIEDMVETNDMYIAWHPDVEFPYEYTRPIPEDPLIESNSLLKETVLNTAMQAFRNKSPEVARQELMNLTHTTKHRWFPRSRDKKAKKTPMDRKYL